MHRQRLLWSCYQLKIVTIGTKSGDSTTYLTFNIADYKNLIGIPSLITYIKDNAIDESEKVSKEYKKQKNV